MPADPMHQGVVLVWRDQSRSHCWASRCSHGDCQFGAVLVPKEKEGELEYAVPLCLELTLVSDEISNTWSSSQTVRAKPNQLALPSLIRVHQQLEQDPSTAPLLPAHDAHPPALVSLPLLLALVDHPLSHLLPSMQNTSTTMGTVCAYTAPMGLSTLTRSTLITAETRSRTVNRCRPWLLLLIRPTSFRYSTFPLRDPRMVCRLLRPPGNSTKRDKTSFDPAPLLDLHGQAIQRTATQDLQRVTAVYLGYAIPTFQTTRQYRPFGLGVHTTSTTTHRRLLPRARFT